MERTPQDSDAAIVGRVSAIEKGQLRQDTQIAAKADDAATTAALALKASAADLTTLTATVATNTTNIATNTADIATLNSGKSNVITVAGTPGDTVTVANWGQIVIGGTTYYLPLYK